MKRFFVNNCLTKIGQITKKHLPSWYLISIDLTFIKDKSSTFHNTCGRKKNKESINELITGQLLM